jgi:hypothetical protein
MNIDRKLNLAIPLERENGQFIFVHAMPIGEQVFDQHFAIIGKTMAAIFNEGFGEVAGPRVAAKVMKKIAIDEQAWDGAMGVNATLMQEIRRLTNILMPAGSDQPMLLLEDAARRGIVTKQELDEVENALVFFTVVSSMCRAPVKRATLDGMAGLWGAVITSSNATEFRSSLQTSKETDSSGETATAS